MKKQSIVLLVTALLFINFLATAKGAIFSSDNLTHFKAIPLAETELFYLNCLGAHSDDINLFSFSRSEIGVTKTLTDNELFSLTSSYLTNDINNYFFFKAPDEPDGVLTEIYNESYIFWDLNLSDVSEDDPVDLYGYTINSISMTLNAFETYYLNATFTVDASPVPIPGTVWLLGPGLLVISGFLRKRKYNCN